MRLGVERVKGQGFDVEVTFQTDPMVNRAQVSGVGVEPALDGQDYRWQHGQLLFAQGSSVSCGT